MSWPAFVGAAESTGSRELWPAPASSTHVAKNVGALLLDGRQRLLLGLRARWKQNWPLCWDCIGGGVEAGETLDGALARELHEEVGVWPRSFCLLGAVPEQRPDLYGAALHHIYLVTEWDGGAPRNVSDEHTEIRWFDLDGVAALNNLADRDFWPLFGAMAGAARRLRSSSAASPSESRSAGPLAARPRATPLSPPRTDY